MGWKTNVAIIAALTSPIWWAKSCQTVRNDTLAAIELERDDTWTEWGSKAGAQAGIWTVTQLAEKGGNIPVGIIEAGERAALGDERYDSLTASAKEKAPEYAKKGMKVIGSVVVTTGEAGIGFIDEVTSSYGSDTQINPLEGLLFGESDSSPERRPGRSEAERSSSPDLQKDNNSAFIRYLRDDRSIVYCVQFDNDVNGATIHVSPLTLDGVSYARIMDGKPLEEHRSVALDTLTKGRMVEEPDFADCAPSASYRVALRDEDVADGVVNWGLNADRFSYNALRNSPSAKRKQGLTGFRREASRQFAAQLNRVYRGRK